MQNIYKCGCMYTYIGFRCFQARVKNYSVGRYPCQAFLYRSYPWRTTTLNTLLYMIRTRVRENSTSQCLSIQTKHEYNLQFNSKLIRTIHYTPKVLAAGNTYTYHYYYYYCHCYYYYRTWLYYMYIVYICYR